MGSQVPYEMATAAVRRLDSEDLLSPEAALSRSWERAAAASLATPLCNAYPRAFRFPNEGARRVRALLRWAHVHAVSRLLRVAASATEIRRTFMSVGCGLGPKQTSLFLRNVGWSSDIAVLDVHLLAYMRMRGLAAEGESVSDLRRYEMLESRLRSYAVGRGEPLGRLDLAIWIVMRTARAERLI